MSKKANKRGFSSLESTFSQMDVAPNDLQKNKSMKRNSRDRQAAVVQRSMNDDGDESINMSSVPSSYQVTSYDSTLIDVPPLDALNSTELPTMTRIDNVANDLRNIGRMQSPTVAPNENKGAHQSRQNPASGQRHHGNSIDVSMVLPTRVSFPKPKRSLNSYLLAPYDGESHTIPPMDALNSTALPAAAQLEIQCNGEMDDGAPSVKSNQRPTTTNKKKPSNTLKNTATDETAKNPKRNENANPIRLSIQKNAQPSNSKTDDGKKQSNNVSVALIAKSRSQALPNPPTSTDLVVVSWMDELKKYWDQVEDRTRSSLKLIKQGRIQSGQPFDEKFKKHFLHSTYKKILIAFEHFLVDERCFDEFFDTTFINTDIDQRGQTNLASTSNGNVHDSELGKSVDCRQSTSHLTNADRDHLSSESSNPNDSIGKSFVCEEQQSDLQISEQNSCIEDSNYDDHTMQQTSISTSRIESSLNSQQRMESNQNSGQQLPSIAEEMEISQRSMTIVHDTVNDMIAVDPDDDLEMTLTNGDAANSHDDQQIQHVMLSDTIIEVNPIETTIDRADVRVSGDTNEGEDSEDDQATGEGNSNKRIRETIDLISDHEEDVNSGDGDLQAVAGPSHPTNQRPKRNNKNAKASGNSKKKSKLADAKDTKKRHKCDSCEYSAAFKSELIRHIRTHSDERPFECKICEKQFTRKDTLNTHLKTHRDLFAFQCSNCRHGFSHEKQWKLHESRCKAKGYECYLCKTVFIEKQQLVDHMRKHTGEKLRCLKCRKQFCYKASLTRHMKMHGKLFRFQCSKCRQGFSNKNLWKSHESQCKSKQYECHLCSKKFHQLKTDLLRHMRHKHTGEKPFGCSNCSKQFCTNSDLTSHMKHRHKKVK